MSKPIVEDKKLYDIIERLYRPDKKPIGGGSTAAALRNELRTGKPTKGKYHLQKSEERIKNLNKWLKNNPTAKAGDRAAAENVLRDLKNVLREKR